MNLLTPRDIEIRHFHLFCGLGGGAKGFNRAKAVVGNLHARLRCIGGVDVSEAAIADFTRLSGVRGTTLDLFSREQYRAFHGCEPPDGWREATPEDIRRAANFERPHIGFGSAPCKGFSGLLSESKSKSAKYDALNQLALRGLWLALEAWADDPPEFWLWENVPRIQTRGRPVLDQMERLFDYYGYAFAETTHDCGELGELAQRRPRFLLVARHREKVPPFLYEPQKRRVRGVGEVLGKFPVPGPDLILPMHRLPRLQWQTWVRLAFVEAGSDWRSLNKLKVDGGVLRDFALAPSTDWYRTALGVTAWNEPAGVVTSEARAYNGKYSVADPRIDGHEKSVQMGVGHWDQPAAVIKGDVSVGTGRYAVADPRPQLSPDRGGLGVRAWDDPSGTIIGVRAPGQGTFSVADPRIGGKPRFNHVYRIVPWQAPSPAVTGSGGPAGGLAVADPRSRTEWEGHGKYIVTPFDEASKVVLAASTTGNGAFAVADPRPGYQDTAHRNKFAVAEWEEPSGTVTTSNHVTGGALCVADPRWRDGKEVYKTTGEYGVVPWDAASGSVVGHGQHDNGRWSVADPREPAVECPFALPAPTERLVAVIQALDGTYHRPFTTLELAALQSLVDPDEILELSGESDAAHRERIGNAVPPDAAQAIGEVMATTLLLAWSGETFVLSAMPVWVQPIAIRAQRGTAHPVVDNIYMLNATMGMTMNQRWRERRDSFRRPDEQINTRRYEVAAIEEDRIAKGFVARHHYSGTYPAARFRYGLYRTGGVLVGVAVFSVPTRNEVLTNVFPGDALDATELGRFVLLDDVEGNGETWFLARCFEQLRGEDLRGVVSFSDPLPRTDDTRQRVVFPGHLGTIYQAHNGVYLGRATARTLHLLPDGTVLSARAMQKIRSGSKGWRYSAATLERHGAAPCPESERTAWLRTWTGRLTRTVRHPGNHKYAWRLAKRVALVGVPQAYPKQRDAAQLGLVA